jgi:hypothetical protein
MEVELKIEEARTAILAGRCFFVLDISKLVDEFFTLKIGDVKEIWPLLLDLLQEVQPENYCVSPEYPTTSKQVILFLWKSKKLKKKMALKFAVEKGVFYYFFLRPQSSHMKI